MLKVALTGNIATGKSSVENVFQSLDVPTIDADKIGHDLLEYHLDTIKEVKKLFEGYDILKNCGGLSRPKIATIIFENKEKRTQLEKILHPKIRKKIKEFFEENQNKDVAIASVPLLYEVNWQSDFDKVLLVVCDENIQLERLIKRANIKKEDAIKRIRAQMPQEEKIKLADYVIENNSNLEALKSTAKSVYAKMISERKQKEEPK